jgi:hypothetical protein
MKDLNKGKVFVEEDRRWRRAQNKEMVGCEDSLSKINALLYSTFRPSVLEIIFWSKLVNWQLLIEKLDPLSKKSHLSYLHRLKLYFYKGTFYVCNHKTYFLKQSLLFLCRSGFKTVAPNGENRKRLDPTVTPTHPTDRDP